MKIKIIDRVINNDDHSNTSLPKTKDMSQTPDDRQIVAKYQDLKRNAAEVNLKDPTSVYYNIDKMREAISVRTIFEDAILYANRGLLCLLIKEGYTVQTLTRLHPSYETKTPLDVAKTTGDPDYVLFMKQLGFTKEFSEMVISFDNLLNLV